MTDLSDGILLAKQWIPAIDLASGSAANVSPGDFFTRRVNLEPNEYACLVQLQVDQWSIVDESRMTIFARDVLSAGKSILDQRDISLARSDPRVFDDIVLRFRLSSPTVVELGGAAMNFDDGARLRHLQILRVNPLLSVEREIFRQRNAIFKKNSLKTLFIGTTNSCNANCHHCPTNKKMTSHLARGIMSEPIFDALLDGIGDVAVNEACFGLFGEPFNDPKLEQRVHRLADKKPGMLIDIATNAGVADLDRVKAIMDRVRRIAIHVEAVNPRRYNKLMAPLRSEEVLPRIDEIVALDPSKVLITTPIHQANIAEARGIVERWASCGAEVRFSQLQTRVTDKTGARRVALAPVPGFWSTDLLDILVVDWDGQVLLTCDDFLRRQPLGDLKHQTVAEIMAGSVRRAAFEDISHYRWHKLPSLCDAMIDASNVVDDYSSIAFHHATSFFRLQPECFQFHSPATLRDGIVELGSTDFPVTPQIFGPYLRLRSGHYTARFSFEYFDPSGPRSHSEAGSAPEIICEVTANNGDHRYNIARDILMEPGAWEVNLRFNHEASHGSVEFRVYAQFATGGASLNFRGVEVSPYDTSIESED